MRYTAKIHVLDILDEIVVSGYVYDADPLTSPDHEPTEFSFVIPGHGISDPYPWLLNAVYRALVSEQRPAQREGDGAPRWGALHTVSETGDTVA